MANYALVDTDNGVDYYEGGGTFDGNPNGKDDITGSAGVDVIDAGTGNDVLKGLGGNDTLTGGNGSDLLVGGSGDDRLTGGNDPDTFSYSFAMTSAGSAGPQSYASYLSEHYDNAAAPDLSQNVFSSSYSAWLDYLVFGGGDWEGLVDYFSWEGEVTVGLNQNGADDSQPHISVAGVSQDLDAMFGDAQNVVWTKGKATQTRTFWDLDSSYWEATSVTSSDGKDTIVDFNGGVNPDKLAFEVAVAGDGTSLTAEEKADLIAAFKPQFDITIGDFDGDGNAETNTDTKMVLDSDMSITLLGYSGGSDIWSYVEFTFV